MNESERHLVETLLQKGTLRPDELDVCLTARQDGESVIDTIVRQGVVDTAELESALAELGPVSSRRAGPLPESLAKLDRYVIMGELGVGGMGHVYLAYDTRLKRSVALKVMQTQGTEDVARYRRELEVAASLQHPNIASVYDAHDVDALFAIAMQYIEGKSLAEAKLELRPALQAVASAARAIHHANACGVVHRDIKPENVMVTKDGRVYVLDFGIARPMTKGPTLTEKGTVVGTPMFMSPEQARGEAVDARTDVYSLGATLYAIVTDRLPFEGSSVVEVMRRVEEEDPVSPRRHNRALPRDVETIVLKAMRKDPAERYAGAAELADDIERFLAGDLIHARPVSVLSKGVHYFRRHPWALATAGAVLMGLAVVGVLVRRGGAQRAGLAEANVLLEEAERNIGEWDRYMDYPPGDLSEKDVLLARAAVSCDAAAESAPSRTAAALYQKSRALSRLGKDAEAEAAVSRALALEGDGTYALERARIRMQRLIRKIMDAPRLSLTGTAEQMRRPLATVRAWIDPSDVRAIIDDLEYARLRRGEAPFETACAGAIQAALEGRFGDAERLCTECLSRCAPWEQAEVHKILAWVYYLWATEDLAAGTQFGQRLSKSVAELTESLQLRRSDPDLYLFRAHVKMAQAWEPWIESSPGIELLPGGRRSLLQSAEFGKKIRELAATAREDVETSLRIRPRNPASYLLLADVYMVPHLSGLFSAFNPTLILASATSGQGVTEGIQARLRRIVGETLDPAEAACEKALVIDPDSVMAWARLAVIHYQRVIGQSRGETARAIETCSHALTLGPDPALEARLRLLRIALRQGQSVVSEEDRRAEREDMERVRAFDPSMLETIISSPLVDRVAAMVMMDAVPRVDLVSGTKAGWTLNRGSLRPEDGGIVLEGCFSQERSYAGVGEVEVKPGQDLQFTCRVRADGDGGNVRLTVLAYGEDGRLMRTWGSSWGVPQGQETILTGRYLVPPGGRRVELWIVNGSSPQLTVTDPRLSAMKVRQ